SRAALAWGVALFACGQLLLAVVMDWRKPVLRDPPYGYKLKRLRTLLAQEPGRPLALILGSSRTEFGIGPGLLPETPDGQNPVVFNFALAGTGPLGELLCLNRLLAEGIRPQWVILEVLPALLHQEGLWSEEDWFNIDVRRLAWNDLPLLQRHLDDPGKL